MRFRLIDTNKASTTIDRMCLLMDVSVSGFYAWKNRDPSKRQLDDMVLLAHIRSQFASSHETYGAPRMHVELKEDGVNVGRHRVARLMRDNGLKALQKCRYKKTTDSGHGGPVLLSR
jgi:putative transposase